jgi:hypothetical protein
MSTLKSGGKGLEEKGRKLGKLGLFTIMEGKSFAVAIHLER